MNNETLSRLCDIFGPKPKRPGGSSELRHIVQSFYLSAAMLAEAKLRDDGVFDNEIPVFNLVIDVRIDRGYIAIVDYAEDKRPFCYLKVYLKWWAFGFRTLEKLAGMVLDYRDTLVERFVELTGQQYCPVKSRIESAGWGHLVSFRGKRTAARPVKWAFSRKA